MLLVFFLLLYKYLFPKTGSEVKGVTFSWRLGVPHPPPPPTFTIRTPQTEIETKQLLRSTILIKQGRPSPPQNDTQKTGRTPPLPKSIARNSCELYAFAPSDGPSKTPTDTGLSTALPPLQLVLRWQWRGEDGRARKGQKYRDETRWAAGRAGGEEGNPRKANGVVIWHVLSFFPSF